MHRSLRIALFVALAAVVSPPVLRAQAPASADSSMLIVFDHDQPVANEQNVYTNMGDSLVVVATTTRSFLDAEGKRHPFKKTMVLVVDTRDMGLIRYESTQDFDGHNVGRGLVPGDTSITYYHELDGAGDADRVVQPPGRLFVMDSQMFSLFDVLCRSAATKTFETRRFQLLAMLADTLATPMATLTNAGTDTLVLGKTSVRTRHYRFEDPSARFELWADPEGRLVRLTHAGSGLRVERVPDEPTRARPAPAKPAAKKTAKPTASGH